MKKRNIRDIIKKSCIGSLVGALLLGEVKAQERTNVWDTSFLNTNKIIEILWEPQFYLDTNVEGKGSITYREGTNGWVDRGKKVTLEATPQSFNYFEGWKINSEYINSSTNPLEIMIDKPYKISAKFKPLLSSRGTPFEWYAIKGITENLENADDEDHDGDGFKGREEYLWGSDPLNPLSFPSIEILKTSEDNKKLLIIKNVAKDRVYRIYSNNSLKPGRWNEKNVVESDLDGDLELEIYSNSPIEFYRVKGELKED